ncbi:MAG: hypothetical protein R2682_01620 [Pyrinomonadaceae bacterium]
MKRLELLRCPARGPSAFLPIGENSLYDRENKAFAEVHHIS